MRYLVGRHPFNHVPIGNGRVLALLQQYALRTFSEEEVKEESWLENYEARKPIDRIKHVLYPYYDRDSSMLGEDGICVSVKDHEERTWYDFYKTWDSPSVYERSAGYLSVDTTRYVDGTGIYEVVSHKAFNVVKTTTWVPTDTDALIRRIEVSSYRKDGRTMDVYPQVHLKGLLENEGNIIISKVKSHGEDTFLAVTCPEASAWHHGDFHEGVDSEFNNTLAKPGGSPAEKAVLSFQATGEVPAGGWSRPVHLVIGFGKSRAAALAGLKQVTSEASVSYQPTLRSWKDWLRSGASISTSDERIAYLWDMSRALVKMSLQEDGLWTSIGYWGYQGGSWIRDSMWVSMCLAMAGHREEALKVLRGFKAVIKKREDGNFCFAYDCRTKEPVDFTTELDSTGLLIAGVWKYYECFSDLEVAREFWDLTEQAAEWMCENRDETGMIIPCAGIWEDFCPRRGRENEHMVWTSGVSAYGLEKASVLAGLLGEKGKSEKYRKAYEELRESILKKAVKAGVLCRSAETDHLDASVLPFFTWMPIFGSERSLIESTIKAVEDRIKDPLQGGIWRHEESIVDLGDVQPWLGCTLWLAEAYLALGKVEEAWTHIDWVVEHASNCGLIPEHMPARGMPACISMPSYSQGGFLAAMLRHEQVRPGKTLCPKRLKHLKFIKAR